MENTKSYALVTGASRGLGRAFALELAQRGTNLILVSLPNEQLEELAEQIKREFGVETAFFETDLSLTENLVSLADWVNRNFKLHIVINNAGFGGGRYFLDVDVAYLENMIQLNVKATALLTRLLLPNLLERPEAYLLNVSSLAALSPIPYKTVYPASKAFVHSFTRSLRKEFEDSTVSFSVVNPGPMKTNSDISARIDGQSLRVKLLVLTAEEVARISIKQLFRKKAVIKLNWAHRLSWFLMNVLPVSVKMHILGISTKREAKKISI